MLMVMELMTDGMQCLDEPENYNDYLDTDGCPDVPGFSKSALSDIDYDAIPDIFDACPTIGERLQSIPR